VTRRRENAVDVHRAHGKRQKRLEGLGPRGADQGEGGIGVRCAEECDGGEDENRIPEAARPDDRHKRVRRQSGETEGRLDRTALSKVRG